MKINKVGVFFYVADPAEERNLLTFEGLVSQIRQKPIKNNPSEAYFIVSTSHMLNIKRIFHLAHRKIFF